MKQARSSATRTRMLDAAEVEFSDLGFDAATMDRIAAAAEVSKSHLYYHFDSKDELLAELFRVRAAQVLADKDDLFSGATALDDALVEKVLTEGIDRLLAAHPRFLRIVMLECFRPGGRTDLVFPLLRSFTDDSASRLRALGFEVDADDTASAMTWFALLPVLGELLVGPERARVLGLDADDEHARFTRWLGLLYRGSLSRLQVGSAR